MPTVAAPRGKTVDVALKAESTWGSVPSGNWTSSFIYSHTLKELQPLEDDKLLGIARQNDRDLGAPAPGLPSLAGDIVAPLDFNHIGLWLVALMGSASISGSGDPYTHVFKSGLAVLPSRSLEVAVKNVGGATKYFVYSGLYANTLALELQRASNYQQMTLGLVGRAETSGGSTSAGTPAAAWARDAAARAIGVFNINDVAAADIVKVTANFDNKLKAKDDIGDAAGYPLGYEFDDESTFSGQLTLRFRATTLNDLAVANTAFKGEMLFSKSGSRSLSLLSNNMRLQKAGLEIAGPGGIQQTFNFRCEQDATHEMLTATLKSSVATYNAL